MSILSTMWTCQWAGRRIQRYLDADPAAPLTAAEVHRLETHLATCEKCATTTEDYRGLRRVLATWSRRRAPDPVLVERVRDTARQLIAEDTG
ncbi:MAG: anti-sigma factor family protein [Nakamurella sp.]